MPGAWAASTSESTPRRSSSRTIVSIGKTRPDGLVTWLTSASRVRGVTAASSASTTSSGCRIGSGIETPTTRAFARCAPTATAVRVALDSWSSVSSSWPGGSRSDSSTVATPVGAFGTGTRPSGSAWRNSAIDCRAASMRSSSSRVRNRIAFDSSSARSARWSSRTGRGQAPYVPWVRYVIEGSRSQGQSDAYGRMDRGYGLAVTLAAVLIVLSGMSGTGKSVLAVGIGRAWRAPVLSVDPIESSIIRAGIAGSFPTGLAAYLVAEGIADDCLEAGLHVVVDAVNSVDEARDMWRRLAGKHEVTMAVIECELSDPSVHAARVAGRDRGLALPEPTWEDVQRRRAEWLPWPEPHLTVDALEPPGANLARALDYLQTL